MDNLCPTQCLCNDQGPCVLEIVKYIPNERVFLLNLNMTVLEEDQGE